MLASIVALKAVANNALGDNRSLQFVLAVLLYVGLWKLLEKADVEGWKGIIPFYNYYVMFEVVAGNGMYFLTMFIPIVGDCVLGYFTAKAYGKPTGFMFGLMLVPSIFFPILGFSDATYYGPRGVNDFRTQDAKEAKTVSFETIVNEDEDK